MACCSPWGHKESDKTQRLNYNKILILLFWKYICIPKILKKQRGTFLCKLPKTWEHSERGGPSLQKEKEETSFPNGLGQVQSSCRLALHNDPSWQEKENKACTLFLFSFEKSNIDIQTVPTEHNDILVEKCICDLQYLVRSETSQDSFQGKSQVSDRIEVRVWFKLGPKKGVNCSKFSNQPPLRFKH